MRSRVRSGMRQLPRMVLSFFAAVSGFAQTQPSNSAQVPKLLDLKTATELMIVHSPVLKREQQAIASARGTLIEAQQRPNPALDISSESYPLFESNPGSFLNQQELTLLAGQTLETAGKRGKRAAVASREIDAVQSSVQDTLRRLKLELKTRYYGVSLAQAQFELAQQLLSQYDDVLRLNEARYKEGEISGLEYSRLQTERFRFVSDLANAGLQVKNSRVALLELLGMADLNADFSVTEPIQGAVENPALKGLFQQAEEMRPDLRAQRQRVERERLNLRLQRANRVPDITPALGYKRDFGQNTIAFGLSFALPVFNRNQGAIARSEAEERSQNFELERIRLQVRREVQQAYDALQTQQALVRSLESTYVPKAQRVRDIAQQSFRAGATDLISFLDTERTFRETLQTYNQVLYDRRIALAKLEAAVGTDF
jgi:cobalt-zinc-cadmium efflux system outer membrane protein